MKKFLSDKLVSERHAVRYSPVFMDLDIVFSLFSHLFALCIKIYFLSNKVMILCFAFSMFCFSLSVLMFFLILNLVISCYIDTTFIFGSICIPVFHTSTYMNV